MPVLERRIHSWLVGWLGAALVRAMHATWHVQVDDPTGAGMAARDGSAAGIIVFWHRHLLSMFAHYHSPHIAAPASESQDGEYAAQVMRRCGVPTVRGSTSRGGLRLLRGMLAKAREGFSLALTPDGPRGPKFSVQPGVALLAERSGLPVYPFGVAVRDAWIARSWDEFVIPKPWTHIVVVMGEPLHADGSRNTPAFCEALRSALFAATERARQALAQSP